MNYFEINLVLNGGEMEVLGDEVVRGKMRNWPANVREILHGRNRMRCFVKLITILIAVRVKRISPQPITFRGVTF